jgi:hypothetical protein
VAVTAIVGRAPLAQAARWAWYYPGPGDGAQLLERFAFLSTTGAGERRLAETVASESEPGDRIYAFRHPSIYFLTGRPAASRLSIMAAFGAGAPAPYVERHLAELARDLEAAPPRLLALPDDGRAGAPCLGCFDPLSRLPATAARLEPRYRLFQRSDGFVVFLRTDGPAPAR